MAKSALGFGVWLGLGLKVSSGGCLLGAGVLMIRAHGDYYYCHYYCYYHYYYYYCDYCYYLLLLLL